MKEVNVSEDIVKPEFKEHNNSFRNYMRDIILGVNDGLVSVYLLVAGIVGANTSSSVIILTASIATIAGAISMMAGEFISTKSQEEVYDADLKMEREHLKYYRDHEIEELFEMFSDIGVKGQTLHDVVDQVSQDDDSIMKVMMAFEFGIKEDERRSPMKAMLTVAWLFVLGAVPSIIPFFFFPNDPLTGFLIASIIAMIFAFSVGAAKTLMTKTNLWVAGAENLLIALVGAGFSYGLGSLVHVSGI